MIQQRKIFSFTGFMLYLLLMQHPSTGQQLHLIKGNIVDSVTHSPLLSALVLIRQTAQRTDSMGNYSFNQLATGKYSITIIAAGYQMKKIWLEIADSSPTVITVPSISISSLQHQLAAVTITGKKPLVEIELDRLIYNVPSDPDYKVSGLLDIIQKVPFLSLDGENNLLMNGKKNFRILIDGRSSALFARNPANVLKSIPAANISRIEVITVPPSKYDGEGLSGIINIITNRKREDGYNGSVSASYGTLVSSATASFDVKHGKWGNTLFMGVSWERSPAATTSNYLRGISPVSFFQHQEGSASSKSTSPYGELTTSYEIDTLKLLTLNFSINKEKTKDLSEQYFTISDVNHELLQSYQLNNISTRYNNDLDAGITFQKGFKRNKTQLLTFFYKYATVHDNANMYSNATEIFQDLHQDRDNLLHEHLGQLDYVQKKGKLNIEAGIKEIYRDNKSDFNTNDSEITDLFNYRQSITGIYNSYSMKFKSWGAKAGGRLERTANNADFAGTATSIHQQYYNLLPSLIIQKVLRTNKDNIRISYTQRIQRPGIALLNPFTDKSDPRSYRSGNPDLLPVKLHRIELTYIYSGNFNITSNMGYFFAKNTIQSLAVPGKDSILRYSYQNVGQNKSLVFSINIDIPISSAVNFTANGNASYTWLRGFAGTEQLSNQGLQGFVYGYLNYKTHNGWRFSARGGFYGPNISLQGNSNDYFFSSLIINKQLFKGNGTFSMAINNPFQQLRSTITTIDNSSMNQQTVNYRYFRNLTVSYTHRFGKLKSEIKKNSRNIVNDDKVATN